MKKSTKTYMDSYRHRRILYEDTARAWYYRYYIDRTFLVSEALNEKERKNLIDFWIKLEIESGNIDLMATNQIQILKLIDKFFGYEKEY